MLECDSVELVGAASRSIEKAQSFQSEFGLARAYGSYEDLLADDSVQAIYNPLPNGLHAEWTIKAMEAGKDVLCEQHFASTAAEAKIVVEAANRTGRKVMEAFMWRFHPQHLHAKKAIADGAIGEVKLVRAAFTFAIQRKPNVRLNAELAGGSVMD